MSGANIISPPVLIIGAGIGGLSLAHALLRHGVNFRIFEQAPEIKEVGAGIQIPPNAMKVLRALGLEDAILSRAFQPESIETRMGQTGREVFTIPLAEYSATRWGVPYLHIHRAAYIAALLEGLPEDTVQLNAQAQSYSQTADGVTLTLADGTHVDGQYLIGADGIRSNIREQMLGADAPKFTGNVAWRAVVPMERLGKFAPSPTACAWFGAGRHAVTYRLGAKGDLANFVGVVEREDWQEEGWSLRGDKAEALSDFAGWHPTIMTLIEQGETFHKWALFDRDPLPTWVDGRVALMGDAAHPMLPFLAQGAAMATEDAWVLANVIAAEEDLMTYQTRRYARTSKVQAASRANMGLFHKGSLPSQIASYGPMWLAGKLTPRIVHRRMDWLYGFDVT